MLIGEDQSGMRAPYRPNRYALFATLRSLWRQREEAAGRDGRYRRLAEVLGVQRQSITQWATGSGDKSPAPWSVILHLCDLVDMGIALEPQRCFLYETPKGRARSR